MKNNLTKDENVPSTIAGKVAFFLISVTIIWTTLIYGTVHQPILGLFYFVVGTLLVLWAVDSYLSRVIRIDRSIFQIPFAAAVVYGFAQVIPYGYHAVLGGVENVPKTISIDPFATKMAAAHFLALLIFLFSALVFIDSKKRLNTLVRLIVIFGFVYAFYAILQMVLSPNKIYGIYTSEFAAPFGSFVNRHNFAAYMEMTIALPLGLLFSRAIDNDKRLLYITALGLMGVALLLSGSRGGLVSAVAAVGFLVLLAFGRSGKRKMLVRIGATLVVISAIVAGAVMMGSETSLTRIAETARTNDFTTNRIEIWSASVKMIAANPVFGVGLGAFGVAYSQFDRSNGLERVEQAHNDYLEVLADGGIVGALIGVFFVFFLFRSGLRAVKSHDPLIRGAAAGALAGCFGVLVHSLFDFVLHTTAVAVLFVSLAAIIGVCDRMRGAGRKKRKKRRESANVTPIKADALT